MIHNLPPRLRKTLQGKKIRVITKMAPNFLGSQFPAILCKNRMISYPTEVLSDPGGEQGLYQPCWAINLGD
jgi:hypothetical protein